MPARKVTATEGGEMRLYTELKGFHDNTALTVTHANALTDGRSIADAANRAAIMFDDPLILRSEQIMDGVLSHRRLSEHARNFLREYYADRDEPLDTNRWREVSHELARTGSYTLTTDELAWGCKTAWRNHSRCIGRAPWQSLLLLDCRHISEPTDVFNQILKHLDVGYNGGILQPVITVFSQDAPVILNKQFIAYAGYSQGAQVIGDPSNVDFTYMCLKLGWYGKGTHFDVLPIVLFDANREILYLYELPEAYHFQVNIEHPTNEDICKLGLKWYSLPAVSFMCIELGGLIYKTAPFNGWYMSTEIATRDFGDQQRYGPWVLPAVAKRMGLNMNTDRLWKDRVVTELNVAVLHSFEKIGVSIVDHYTLSDRFMQWHKSEIKTRGHCAADWVWIVPPTSGSLCPVFHQEMLNYTTSPNYFYPDPAIVTRAFRASQSLACRRDADGHLICDIAAVMTVKSNRDTHPSLKSVALMVLAATYMRAAAAFEQKLAGVFYASETGTSKEMAYETLESISQIRGIKGAIYNFAEIAEVPIRNLQYLFFIVATAGSGEAPSSCRDAEEWLQEFIWSGRGVNVVREMPCAVLALGSSAYPKTYCSFGRQVSELLSEGGVKPMLPLREADAIKNQKMVFDEWLREVRLGLAVSLGLSATDAAAPGALSAADFALKVRPRGILLPAPQPERSRFIVADRRSVTAEARAAVAAVVLRPEDRSMLADGASLHQPGDHMIVRPENSKEAAHRVAKLLGVDDMEKVFTLVDSESGEAVSNWWRFTMPMTFDCLFVETLDLSAPPAHELIQEMLDIADCTSALTKKRLSDVAKRADAYLAWIRNEKPNLSTLLETLCITEDNRERLLISVLTKQAVVRERYYSIASNARETIDLCFDSVSIGGPQKRFGLGSSFLEHADIGQSVVARITRGIFELPPDNAPVVMFAGGSGIAPFRSFWQHFERKTPAERPSTFALFYGFRFSAHAPYVQEVRKLTKRGVITALWEAPSREPPRRYVGTVMQNEPAAAALVRRAVAEGGYFYICGSVRFWEGVRSALEDALAGDTTLAQLSDDGRLWEEPFTSTNDYGDSADAPSLMNGDVDDTIDDDDDDEDTVIRL